MNANIIPSTRATWLLLMFCRGEVKVKFTLEQNMKAQRGGCGIDLIFL